MDDKAELLAFARESATAGVDLYDLLGIDGSTPRDDIHRAWRRKGLKYHPDKAGANYDPAIYERFARARDVLVSDEARKVYDTGRAAAAQRRLQSEQMTAERRRFKDELEAAERAHGGAAGAAAAAGGAPFAARQESTVSSERDKLREAGRRQAEERRRREQEAKDQAWQREDDRIAELERRLREKEDKARRRAEKKAGARGGAAVDDARKADIAASQATTSASASQPPMPQPDAAWRHLLKTGAIQAKEGDSAPIQQRPLFAYTMDRLKKAGAAQRQREAAAHGKDAPPFEAQWDDVDDPEVHKFITRVPRFAPPPSVRLGDVPMDTVG